MTRYCVYISFLRMMYEEYIIMSCMALYSINWMI
jgi:hypothetical protein